jgi:hypothetical protein
MIRSHASAPTHHQYPWLKGDPAGTPTAYEPGLRGPFAYPEPFDYV